MKIIKFAIIGAGTVSHLFAKILRHIPELELAVVCDIDQKKADHLAAKYDAKATTDIHQIIDDSGIELVYIAVPPRFHLEITRSIIQAKKHVIAEKPLAVTLEEAAELVRLSKATSKICTVNFQDRFSFTFQKLKALLAEDFLGKIMDVQITLQYPGWPRAWQNTDWVNTQLDGGPTREVGSHYIFQLVDLVPYVGEVVDLHSEVFYPDEIHPETKAHATINLSSGVSCTYTMLVDNSVKSESTSLLIHGEKGSLRFAPPGRKLFFQKKGNAPELLENDSKMSCESSTPFYTIRIFYLNKTT